MEFHKGILKIDCGREADRISDFIRSQAAAMKREGAVVGLSGGIDSALAAELCVRALGRDRVLEAYLARVRFSEADLTGAIFEKANLVGADLGRAQEFNPGATQHGLRGQGHHRRRWTQHKGVPQN